MAEPLRTVEGMDLLTLNNDVEMPAHRHQPGELPAADPRSLSPHHEPANTSGQRHRQHQRRTGRRGHRNQEKRQGVEELYGRAEVTADDIAEVIAFTLIRPRHRAINEILLRPAGQR